MKNYWLHRISYHAEVSYPLLDNNFLTIGFSDFADQSILDKIQAGTKWETRWNQLEISFDEMWGSRPRTRHNLWRFIEMKKDDLVVIPSWGTFSVYKIVAEKPAPIGKIPLKEFRDWQKREVKVKDGLLYREATVIDLGFFWEVRPIATGISRYDYADSALTARMKIRSTNALITDLQHSVQNAILAYELKRPINLHSQIVEAIIPQVLKTLKTELSPDKFETIIKWYFERIGATEVYIPSKNENGKEGDADVIAIFEPIKTVIYVQAKFHDGETSTWAIDQIIAYKNNKEKSSEAMDDGYTRIGWVISTSERYSDECSNMAKEDKIQLVDGRKFAIMLIEAGIININKAFM